MDLKHLGFIVNPNIRLVHNVNEILDYIEEWTEKETLFLTKSMELLLK